MEESSFCLSNGFDHRSAAEAVKSRTSLRSSQSPRRFGVAHDRLNPFLCSKFRRECLPRRITGRAPCRRRVRRERKKHVSTLTLHSIATKRLMRAESRTPAMPSTGFFGKPLTLTQLAPSGQADSYHDDDAIRGCFTICSDDRFHYVVVCFQQIARLMPVCAGNRL